MNKNFKTNSKGITLIALVITIIVLLILAGVSIAAITSDDGIIKQAQNAKDETEKANMEERIDQVIIEVEGTHRNPSLDDIIDELLEKDIIGSRDDVNKETGSITTKNPTYVIDGKLDDYLGNSGEEGKPTDQGTLGTITGDETTNTTVKDKLGNEVKVPAGFKIVNPTETVPDGIIIEDVDQTRPTVGSQFVWIPVGTVKKSDGSTETIKLSRYTFDEIGEETDQGESEFGINEGDYYVLFQELEISDKGNTTAKDIKTFKTKAATSKGYYIGRYEARDKNVKTARTDTTSDANQVVTTGENYIYNYVTQPQAAELSRNMYSNNNFESDLTNSYAWDTAITFLQKFDNRENKTKPYSLQKYENKSLAIQGTNKLTVQDKICNIYDMSENTCEFTTETSYAPYSSECCTPRGGRYNDEYDYTAFRRIYGTYRNHDYLSFRPILYL